MKRKEREFLETGWLAGLVDGEGFISIRYRKDRGTMFPRIRIYCTSRPIIDEAGRIMNVNPFPRRDHGVFKGWYVSASHQKALKVLRRIAPHLKDPSKKCRTDKILRTFTRVATLKGNLTVEEFFADCPRPTRYRKRRKI
ncbi:MAG TPA: hypothetical protein VIW22_01605 [Nitrososphaerales archaeon]